MQSFAQMRQTFIASLARGSNFYVNCVNDYMKNNLKLSTNYIIKSLFEQEYYYFTVRELAGLLKVPLEKAYYCCKDQGQR